jgi:hypothetical protein
MDIEEVAKVSRRMLPHLKMGVIQGLIYGPMFTS